MKSNTRQWLWLLMPVMVGVVTFFFITGGTVLNPQNIDWLMAGDPAQHWLGWQFFRSSPLLQWPLGANPEFGLELGSSVVFSDSIPLMAFIFKLLNPLLPEHFQYTGIWLLMCFCLQALFSWKLLELFTANKILLVLGCLFFAMAPSFVWRMHAHFALSAHWLLIAGLYLYFSKPLSLGRWAALLSVGVLIHAYLVAMLMAIALTDLVQRRWLKQIGTAQALGCAVGAFALVGLIMWATGYFMVGGGVESYGFGVYRMNLFSAVDSDGQWSTFLPDVKGIAGDYEGFNYLGTGILGLAVIALVSIKRGNQAINRSTLLPISVLCVSLFFYALSNHIAVGTHELLAYYLPGFTKRLTDTFRASGRFFWPTYYAIYLAVFYLVFTRFKARVAIALCASMLLFQVFDTHQARAYYRDRLTHAPAWNSPMVSSAWQDIAQRYKTITLVLPDNAPVDWLPISQFASTHGMSTNAGYFARVDPEIKARMREQLASTVTSGQYDPETLYIFNDTFLWEMALANTAPADSIGNLDGFRVLAPAYNQCKTCATDAIKSVAVQHNPADDYSGGVVSFIKGAMGAAHLVYGWGDPEEWGTWSSGKTAVISFNLKNIPDQDLAVIIKGQAFISEKHPRQTVEVLLKNQPLSVLTYDATSPSDERTVKIPKQSVIDSKGKILISLHFKDATSPKALGLSEDSRLLGLRIVSVEIKPE